MQNSMVVFPFSVLDQKHTFKADLVQKIKIVSLSWNLVPTTIHKIFETNSSFYVKKHTTGKFSFYFSRVFC